jgi:hypothetical protein
MTVGQYVQKARALLQAVSESENNEAQWLTPYTTFAAIVRPGGQIDFKMIFTGQASHEMLGDAGNFAYYAIGEGYIPDTALDLGAGAYGVYGVLVGTFPPSFLTGPFFSDDSARRQRGPGLSSDGC